MRVILPLLLCLMLVVACGTPDRLAQAPLQSDTSAAASSTAGAAPATSELVSTPITTDTPATPAPAPTATATPDTTAPTPTADILTPTPRLAVDPTTAQRAEAVIRQQAGEVMAALKQRDMQRLATFVHPDKGLRFSQYGHARQDDLVFPAAQVALMNTDTMTYTWGAYDGSGFPIDLTPAAYFDRFVYSQDFVNAEQLSYNQTLAQGNTVENSLEFYGPDALVVDYHFPGFDPKYEGMDWQSLRVVFEELDQRWYLVGIIHAEWTI